jgi:2-dehydro-3-deoxyglucarate aldolase
MHDNPVKEALRSGRITTGTWLTLGSPAVAEALAHCGFDWLVVDLEHAPNDPASAVEQLRAIDAARANGGRAEGIVRLAENDPVLAKRAMDIGARTLIFPNVNSADEARAAVRAMRYPHNSNGGVRGVAGLVRAGRYGLDPAYVKNAHDRVCTIVQIESRSGVDNAAAICATEGVDCVFLGPSDLAASLGHLGDIWHPEVARAMQAVVVQAREAGKAVGVFANDADDAKLFVDWGVTFVGLHSDVRWLCQGSSQEVRRFASGLQAGQAAAVHSAS